MGWVICIVLLLILLPIFLRILKILFALFVLRKVGRAFLSEVGAEAMSRQPDEIHLTPVPDYQWMHGESIRELSSPLVQEGFVSAGKYSIAELPDFHLGFLVNASTAVAAAVYEHPKVGTWIDLVCRYDDGSGLGITYTTARDRGIEKRPGATTVHAPEATSAELYQRLLAERPSRPYVTFTADNIVGLFEDAYAIEQAWRKNKGLSPEEVARSIQTQPAEA